MDMNMDIKDVIAKLKSGKGGKKNARKKNAFNAFFEKNPKMKIILPLVFIVIAAVVAALIIISGIKTDSGLDETVTNPAQSVDVLPMIERSEGETVAEGVDPFSEDVIANAKIKGMVYNSDGYRTVIVETKLRSYVLQVGDYVPGSEWLVESITDSSVTFSLGEKTRTVEMK